MSNSKAPAIPPPSAAACVSLDPLVMFVIYDRPRDYPTNIVVRKWFVVTRAIPSGVCTLYDSIEHARAGLPPGLTLLPRDPRDEPQIVESWI